MKVLLRRIFWISLFFFLPMGLVFGFFLTLQPGGSPLFPAFLLPYKDFLLYIGAFGGLICAIFFRMLAGLFAPREKKEPVRKREKPGKKKKTEIPGEDPSRKELDQRLFFHLLSSLQKEARFLDFLAENLDVYEDAQIGAAVRPVHQNSRKVLDRYLETGVVMEEEEGGEVLVPEGFDPGYIRLVGRVAGDPPFHGILRHRGWRAKNIRIPVFSGTGGSEVLAPAEVEVL